MSHKGCQRLCINYDPGEGELLDDHELYDLDSTPALLGQYLLNVNHRLRRIEDHARQVLVQTVGDDGNREVQCRVRQGNVQLEVAGVIPPDQVRPLGKSLHDLLPQLWNRMA